MWSERPQEFCIGCRFCQHGLALLVTKMILCICEILFQKVIKVVKFLNFLEVVIKEQSCLWQNQNGIFTLNQQSLPAGLALLVTGMILYIFEILFQKVINVVIFLKFLEVVINEQSCLWWNQNAIVTLQQKSLGSLHNHLMFGIIPSIIKKY